MPVAAWRELTEAERGLYNVGVADYLAGRPKADPPQAGLSYQRLGWLDTRDVAEAYGRAAAEAMEPAAIYTEVNGTPEAAGEQKAP